MLEGFLHDSLGPERFRTTLLLVLAGLGLALAAVGIYGDHGPIRGGADT